ncbi:HDOD domain-containing protein [Piscinibacter defluvii]|uniref:HDOD domain-containing protein n=1 Tax=Piscinibacter defluvii TaxID=1796922 RepID=UPI000FDE03C9|nr:HDOD domain-containing protein [Piscinibacter defluvii]
MNAPAPVDALLDRLSRQPDFPSLPGFMPEVRRLARCDRARVQSLSSALLKDIGLSQRLLRLVNAAYYRAAGAGHIVTVTRAIAVLGFEAVGRLAVAARMVESVARRSGNVLLREECLRAMLAGQIAEMLAEGRRDAEDAYLAALFRNLGRLLLALHLPEQAQALRAAVAPALWPRGDAEEAAARRQLGLGCSEIAQQVAGPWGWPAELLRAMWRDPAGLPPAPGARFGPVEIAILADDLADLMLHVAPERWAGSHPRLLRHPDGPDARRLDSLLQRARLRLPELAAALDLTLERFPAWGGRAAGGVAPEATAPLPDPLALPPATPGPAVAPRGAELLGIAIQDLSAALVAGGDALAGAPALALESLWRGLEARAAMLFLAPSGRGPMHGLVTLSRDGAAQWHAGSRIDPDEPRELFAMLCRRGADTLIEDAAEPRIAQRLPDWFRAGPAARRFMVLPLQVRGRPLGMIYLDAGPDAPLRPDEACLRLARSLRNQLVLALPAP